MSDYSLVPAPDFVCNDRHLFTAEQANQTLPYVSRVVADIVESYTQILELRRELENLDDGDLRELTEREYESTMDRLGQLVDELHATGAELRDFERGRVEFHLEGDDLAMLTWQLGDHRVRRMLEEEIDQDVKRLAEALRESEAA